jgi:hypothetical protein
LRTVEPWRSFKLTRRASFDGRLSILFWVIEELVPDGLWERIAPLPAWLHGYNGHRLTGQSACASGHRVSNLGSAQPSPTSQDRAVTPLCSDADEPHRVGDAVGGSMSAAHPGLGLTPG